MTGELWDRPEWMRRDDLPCREAKARGINFYPQQGQSTLPAKTVCRSCPCQFECLEYALELPERFGIWGGLSERQRRRIRQQRGMAGPAAPCGTDAAYYRHRRLGETPDDACRKAHAAVEHARRERERGGRPKRRELAS